MEEEKRLCCALTLGDGWWANMLFSTKNYTNGDLAQEFHEFCRKNCLDTKEYKNAEFFLKEIKIQQKINKMNEDFE